MNIKRFVIALVLALAVHGLGECCRISADDNDHQYQLSLADLTGYRAALAGHPTAGVAKATDSPVPVHFRDLWDHSEAFRGRRVTVEGLVVRIFRQGPVGTFPALAEVWITSPAGDPFCLVFPQTVPGTENHQASAGAKLPATTGSAPARSAVVPIPTVGRTARFTGTFLKMVSYSARDEPRLVPLVVGSLPPVTISVSGQTQGPDSSAAGADSVLRAIGGRSLVASREAWRWSTSSWILGLTLAAFTTGVLTWQHMRKPRRRGSEIPDRAESYRESSPHLEFLNSSNDA